MKQTTLAFLLFLSVSLFAEGLNDATIVARKGYRQFLQGPLSNTQFRAAHNLSAGETSETATLGEPIPLYTIPNDNIVGYQKGSSLKELYEKTDVIMFPVLFNGKAKLFLNVSHYGTNELQIGSLGLSTLAAQIEKIQQRFPLSDGYSVLVLNNCQTHTYLFHVPQLNDENLTIIEIDSTKSYATLDSAEETIPLLKARLLQQ